MSASFVEDPILLEMVRNDLVESVHRGRFVITAAGGEIERRAGAIEAPIYPRSTVKPLQAVGMLRSGLDLDGELLALAAASHSGEAFHREGARRILSGAGVDEAALQNVADWPTDEQARVAWIRDGHDQEPIAMNCSGKHAAMIKTCVNNRWPIDSYRDPSHPLQRAILDAIEELTAESAGPVTVDGCGAPLFPISLLGLARAFGRVAAAEAGPERAVADAYRAHPEWVSGTRRDEAELHRAIPGLICKAGAEAVYAAGLPDGRGIAIKIDDGASRGLPVLMAKLLTDCGYRHDTLDRHSDQPVLGHGEPVGMLGLVELG